MAELPRLSGALRVFGNVTSQDDNDSASQDDLVRRKSLALDKQKEKSLSWKFLCSFLKSRAQVVSHSELDATLKQLMSHAKAFGRNIFSLFLNYTT